MSPIPPTSPTLLSTFTSSKVKDLKTTWDKPPIAAKPEMRRESNLSLTEARPEQTLTREGRRESSSTGSENRRESVNSTTGSRIPTSVGGDRRGSAQFLARNDSSRYNNYNLIYLF